MITGLLASRGRVILGSTLSMVATDIASAKLSTMLVNAKSASIYATKLVATKVIVKVTALWLLVMSFFMPLQQVKPVGHPSVVPLHRVSQAPRNLAAAAAPTVASENIRENPLYLHTFEREYTCVFTGKVTCGQGLCESAAVQIHIMSRKNPNLMKTAVLQPDGTYEISFLLKESPQEHLDWWIIGDSSDSASRQIQGREILMDEANIKIDQPLALL